MLQLFVAVVLKSVGELLTFQWWGLLHLCSNIIVPLHYGEPAWPFPTDFPFAFDAMQAPKST